MTHNNESIKRNREEDAEAGGDYSPSTKKIHAWPPAKPFGRNLPDHASERGSITHKRLYFGTWAEEEDVGTKKRLLNNRQTSVVTPSAEYNLQNYFWPDYPVLHHCCNDKDVENFVYRMHSWREYFSQRSPTNRATAPLAPPSQEIPLPTPPAKPTKPAVPGQPEVPSAGHSRLLIAASFEETGEAALKSDFSNGIEEENGENADENTEDDDDEEEDTETDTEDDEDEDTEDDTEGVANDKEDEKAEGNEHVKVFILTKARAPVKDRKVEGCILHTLLKNRHEEQETPRPRTPAPIIMSWDGVVDCPTKRTAATPAPSLMDSQYNAMQLLQPTPFATPTPPADFDAFTHNSYNNNPLLITPSVTPFYDSTTWNLFAAHVPLPCPHEPDFPAVMGLQSLPLLDPLLMTPFPAPATTNDWNYNLPPPSAEFPADWLTAPTPDDLSILGLEFLLFGGGV